MPSQTPAAEAKPRDPVIRIAVNGGRSSGVSGDETAAACAPFRLTEAQVRAFFRRAKRVGDRAYNHDLDMSPCYAAGTITGDDGRDAEWSIDQAGRGQLIRADGERRYLFCGDCPVPPFHEPAPEDAEAEAGVS